MTYTKKQMIEIIGYWFQTISPEMFTSSEDLLTIDFLDAPRAHADELGISEEEMETQLRSMGLKEEYWNDFNEE